MRIFWYFMLLFHQFFFVYNEFKYKSITAHNYFIHQNYQHGSINRKKSVQIHSGVGCFMVSLGLIYCKPSWHYYCLAFGFMQAFRWHVTVRQCFPFFCSKLYFFCDDLFGILRTCFCVGYVWVEICDCYPGQVVNYWAEKGVSGFTVFKFRLKRIEGQPELTTNQVCTLSDFCLLVDSAWIA